MDRVTSRSLTALLPGLEADHGPLYQALSDRIRSLVADGRLPVGCRLPPERELATTMRLSRSTVTSAYGRLRDQGWASARQGAGTWTALPAGPDRGAWVPATAEDSVIDMSHAAPPAPPEVAAAFASALDDLPRLLPGHGYHPAGLPELRARVAERYTARGLPTSAEQIVITAGALHAISATLQACVRRGQRLLVEQPSYPSTLDLARTSGLRLTPVALDGDDPGAFVSAAARALAQTSPAAAYVMPDFQNPTGTLLGETERTGLARALRRAGALAVVDETLLDLGIDAVPGTPLTALVPGVAVGSLSKSFWGGLRVGWTRSDTATARAIAGVLLRAYMSGPVLEQLAACRLLDDSQALLGAQRRRLAEQRDALVTALTGTLPDWRFTTPAGGLVLWCQLPTARSTRVVVEAEGLGVRLAAGPRFGSGHALDDRLRLPFAHPPAVLRRAVDLLARADEAATGVPAPDRRVV